MSKLMRLWQRMNDVSKRTFWRICQRTIPVIRYLGLECDLQVHSATAIAHGLKGVPRFVRMYSYGEVTVSQKL